jgi:predicted NUDIX family NTP pyrophosphohydrolase
VAKTSAGILCWRQREALEVLIVHPGGPYFAGKDEGVWSIPKGELDAGESAMDAALREFVEETGFAPPPREALVDLGTVTLRSGKVVQAWATPWDVDPEALVPGTFTMEWPRGSGRTGTFPEVDRAAWLSVPDAARKLNPAQVPFLVRLVPGPRPG